MVLISTCGVWSNTNVAIHHFQRCRFIPRGALDEAEREAERARLGGRSFITLFRTAEDALGLPRPFPSRPRVGLGEASVPWPSPLESSAESSPM